MTAVAVTVEYCPEGAMVVAEVEGPASADGGRQGPCKITDISSKYCPRLRRLRPGLPFPPHPCPRVLLRPPRRDHPSGRQGLPREFPDEMVGAMEGVGVSGSRLAAAGGYRTGASPDENFLIAVLSTCQYCRHMPVVKAGSLPIVLF